MPRYSYTAKSEEGESLEGNLYAENISAAHSALTAMNISPIEIFEEKSGETHSFDEDVSFESDMTPTLVDEGLEITEHGKQSEPVDWSEVDSSTMHTVLDTKTPLPAQSPHLQTEEPKEYFPISDTLKLYAGWLFAWYFIVYALGAYQMSRDVPFNIPYVEAWLPPYSPLILTFALASFLYLLFAQLHKTFGGGRIKGFAFALAWVSCFVLYRVNV